MAKDPFFKAKIRHLTGNIAIIAIILLLPFILISGNLLLPAYNKEIYPEEANEIYEYLASQSFSIGNLTSSLTEREVYHLSDVKELISNAILLFWASIILLIIMLAYLTAIKERHRIGLGIVWGSCLTLFLLILFIIIGYTNFEWLFVKFHEVFFSNDYWLLPTHSRLLAMFPESFFYALSKKVALRIMIESTALLCIGYVIKYDPTRNLPGGR